MLVRPPCQDDDDALFWRPATDGNFSIQSAYRVIRDEGDRREDPYWQQIWRWPIPERTKMFMWQAFHEKLPTNMLRAKRGICESNKCPFECNSEESIIHILRDCEVAYRLWCCLINPIYHSTFFSENLQDWLEWNVKNKPATRRYSNWPWMKIFSTICWLVWKNICKRVFEGTGEQPGSILQRFQHHLKEGVEEGRYKHQIYKVQGRNLAKWQCPPEGFIRIDVDGSVTENNQAACGGIIRNSSGT